MENNSKFDFSSSPLKEHFIAEIYNLCMSVRDQTKELFEIYDEMREECNHGFFMDARVNHLEMIYSILSNAARIQEFITVKTKNKKELREERIKYLNNVIKPFEFQELFNNKIRNTIEHYAEYLDEENQRHAEIKEAAKKNPLSSTRMYFVATNLTISHWESWSVPDLPIKTYRVSNFQYPVYPIRIYLAYEKRFYNMDWYVDLKKMQIEAIELMQVLKENHFRLKGNNPEEYYSSMYVLEY